MVDIKSYKLSYVPQIYEPNVKLYVKIPTENFVRQYITSNAGIPIPLKDEVGTATASLVREDFTYTTGLQIFTLLQNYGQVYSVEVQGQGALSLSQYTLVAPNKVQILDTLGVGDYIVILYSTDVAAFTTYSPSLEVTNETPIGAIDGSNAIFTTAYNLQVNTEQIYVNGQRQKKPDDYNISGQTITLTFSPNITENLLIDYIKQ